jgi:hypothetical protein
MEKEDFDLELLRDFLDLAPDNNILHINEINVVFPIHSGNGDKQSVLISADVSYDDNKYGYNLEVKRGNQIFAIYIEDYKAYIKKVDRNRKIGGLLK